MKVSSDIDKKIIRLQQEIKNLKTSQIIGGDNSRIYNHYIIGHSPQLYYKDGMWVRKRDYDDPEFFPVPGGYYTVTSTLYSLEDDPFALVGVDKLEVWRNGHLLEWSAYKRVAIGQFGQQSQYGDVLIVRYTKTSDGYGSVDTPTLGTQVRFEMSADFITDSPASPIQYEYRIWLKTTSISDYGWIEDWGVS